MARASGLMAAVGGWLRTILYADGADVGAANPLPVYVVPVADDWHPDLQVDEAANDSDKTFTVPADTEWYICWIWVEYASTATVGVRQLVVQLQDDAADVIGEIRMGLAQAASLTRYYQIGPSLGDLVAARDGDWLMTPLMSTTVLPAGYVVRVYDNNAVAAAADDMVVQMMVMARAV